MNDISFCLQGKWFEYDEDKNRKNINKHGLSLKTAARVFFDYDRIEFDDSSHSIEEDRYNTIGDLSIGDTIIGKPSAQHEDDIIFVVYTERQRKLQDGKIAEFTRIVSARLANEFERGLYYGNQDEY